ncbi:MAG: hypothetical protein GY722_25065, partial [bacterium]|nr:hypothetical protein [bacterium]
TAQSDIGPPDGRPSRIGRRVWLGVAAVVVAVVAVALGLTYLGSDDPPSASPIPDSTTTEVPDVDPVVIAPAATGPLANSERVMAFYYTPWESQPVDGRWYIWDDNGGTPPDDICCEFYPSLGPYSSNDVSVVNQHFAWFNQAGIGIVAFDWWGSGSKEDQQVPTILDAAERYGLSVAFVINQYGGRSIGNLPASVEYLYEQ